MSKRIYTPVFYEPTLIVGQPTIALSEDEGSHAVRVMRVRQGDSCVVVNGTGLARQGRIVHAEKSEVSVDLGHTLTSYGEPRVNLTMALGLSSNEKFDDALTAGIEAGASSFVPLICERTKFSPSAETTDRRQSRWQRLSVAAIKQSRRSRLPAISEPTSLAHWLGNYTEPIIAFSPSGEQGLAALDRLRGASKVTVLVGPEAGFSDPEEESLRLAGVQVISLGERILRFETAVPVVAALILAAAGEYS